MREFFPEALVKGHEPLGERMANDPKDRHVLAAAVACGADYLVTFNFKHLSQQPATAAKHETTIVGPSTFLSQLFVANRAVVEERLCDQA